MVVMVGLVNGDKVHCERIVQVSCKSGIMERGGGVDRTMVVVGNIIDGISYTYIYVIRQLIYFDCALYIVPRFPLVTYNPQQALPQATSTWYTIGSVRVWPRCDRR